MTIKYDSIKMHTLFTNTLIQMINNLLEKWVEILTRRDRQVVVNCRRYIDWNLIKSPGLSINFKFEFTEIN